MLSETVQQAINDQINLEFASSHAYLSMSAYFETLSLMGFAHWMRKQSEEEHEHAMKFFDFVNDRGGRVVLKAIEEPQTEFASPLTTMQSVLEHERKVTASIHRLYDLAGREKDFATQSMLKWFIDEQVEEEKAADEVIQSLKLIGDDGSGLYMLDRQLAERE
jgi:ferritin